MRGLATLTHVTCGSEPAALHMLLVVTLGHVSTNLETFETKLALPVLTKPMSMPEVHKSSSLRDARKAPCRHREAELRRECS